MNWSLFFHLSSPWLILLGVVALLLILAAAPKLAHQRTFSFLSLVGIGLALIVSWKLWLMGETAQVGMMLFDRLTMFGWLLLFLAALLSLLLSPGYLVSRKAALPEYYILFLLSVIGQAVLVASADLLTFFLGLEIMSIPLYALVGFLRTRPQANEAALKYFLTGAFASAFLLMGIAFLFGSTGTTDLNLLSQRAGELIASPHGAFFLFGIAMLLVGFAFKIAAVPFHAWAPDAYEGAPTPITAFMATAIKAAAFLAFFRVALLVFHHAGLAWQETISILAVATMTVGNLAALRQDDLKRMLAYSSIAHAGYLLVGFPLIGGEGADGASIGFYLFAYVMMTMGVFGVVIAAQGDQESTDMSMLAGLKSRRPLLAAALSLFLLSLTGFPPTIGFFAKYYLFLDAMKGGLTWLVVAGLLNAAVSAYYYLRPVVVMYFHEPSARQLAADADLPGEASAALVAVAAVSTFAVIFFGIFPTSLLTIVASSFY